MNPTMSPNMNRTRRLIFAVILPLLALAGTLAARPAAAAPPPGGAPATPVVLYDQFDHFGTQTAQSVVFHQPSYPGMDCYTTDDFVVPAGQTWTISQVEAQIQFFNNSTVAPVNVYFWQDASGLPGPLLYSRTMIGPSSGGQDAHMVVPLPTVLTIGPGHYWFSVQANFYSIALGDWAWVNRTVTANNEADFVNGDDGYNTGCIFLSPRYGCWHQPTERDQVFRLDGTLTGGPTPVPTQTPLPTSTPVPPATSTPDPSATPCATSFSDVRPADYFYTPVRYLACHGMVSGYGDGTFRPYARTTRGQLAKMVVLSFGLPAAPAPPNGFTFTDVPPAFPFFGVVESAVASGVVSGYACGGPGEPCDGQNRPYFRPYADVTRGQLAKLIVAAGGWVLQSPATGTFADVAPGSTFYPFIETAYCHGVISGYACGGAGEACDPQGRPYFRPYTHATRGQISKIVYQAITTDLTCGPVK